MFRNRFKTAAPFALAAILAAAPAGACTNLLVTAGASAPETLVDEVIAAAKEHFTVTVDEIIIKDENVVFKIPKILAA